MPRPRRIHPNPSRVTHLSVDGAYTLCGVMDPQHWSQEWEGVTCQTCQALRLTAACDAAWGPVTEADMEEAREKQAAAQRAWWGALEPSAGRTR